MTTLSIKRLATVLMKNRAGWLVTREDILTSTASDLYDGFIKPLGKYGNTKMVSRFGIDEETWKAVQEEIKSREVTAEDIKTDKATISQIREDMRSGGVIVEEDEEE